MKAKKESTEIKCPLCKLSISEETFQDHLRLELLDPKWKEIQKEVVVIKCLNQQCGIW